MNAFIQKIQDQPGQKEVVLTQTFGNEQIKVFFSTEAVNEMREEEGAENVWHAFNHSRK